MGIEYEEESMYVCLEGFEARKFSTRRRRVTGFTAFRMVLRFIRSKMSITFAGCGGWEVLLPLPLSFSIYHCQQLSYCPPGSGTKNNNVQTTPRPQHSQLTIAGAMIVNVKYDRVAFVGVMVTGSQRVGIGVSLRQTLPLYDNMAMRDQQTNPSHSSERRTDVSIPLCMMIDASSREV